MKKIKEELRVFFTCASSFIEIHRETALQILSQLDNQNCIVLHDWVRSPREQRNGNTSSIYNTTTSAIKHSDLVVAEVSFPSTSVGEQIAYASSLGVHVVCLYDKQIMKAKSRYLIGTKSEFIKVVEYNQESIEQIIRDAIHLAVKNEFVKFNFISTARLNALLNQESKKLHESKSHLLRSILQEWFGRNHQC